MEDQVKKAQKRENTQVDKVVKDKEHLKTQVIQSAGLAQKFKDLSERRELQIENLEQQLSDFELQRKFFQDQK